MNSFLLNGLSLLRDGCYRYSGYERCDGDRAYVDENIFYFGFKLVDELCYKLIDEFLKDKLFGYKDNGLKDICDVRDGREVFNKDTGSRIMTYTNNGISARFIDDRMVLDRLRTRMCVEGTIDSFGDVLDTGLTFTYDGIEIPRDVTMTYVPICIVLRAGLRTYTTFDKGGRFTFRYSCGVDDTIDSDNKGLGLLIVIGPTIRPPINFNLKTIYYRGCFTLKELDYRYKCYRDGGRRRYCGYKWGFLRDGSPCGGMLRWFTVLFCRVRRVGSEIRVLGVFVIFL